MSQHPRRRFHLRMIPRLLRLVPVCLLLLAPGGCATLGVVASKVVPPPKVAAAYKDLGGRSVGVMVWADRGLRIDYPNIQLDIARDIHNKLQVAQSEAKAKELKGTTFQVMPESIYNYQRKYPQIEGMQLVEVAPKLGVQRLIYLEITGFSTRPEPSIELFRGAMEGSIKVVEVAPDKTARVAFTDDHVRAAFPRKAPPDGIPSAGDYRIYRGTVDAFTTQVVRRFLEHEEEE